MLTVEHAVKILNNNKKGKKYTNEQARQIIGLLNQFGEIAYLEFKNRKDEESNIIREGIN